MAMSDVPLTFRYNNPLALEFKPWMAKYGAQVGPNGRYAAFQDPEQGYKAASQVLDTYGNKYGLNTVSGIVNRWAPRTTDNNSTDGYIKSVAMKLGVDPNQPIAPEMRRPLMEAMASYESGKGAPNATYQMQPAAQGQQPMGLTAAQPQQTNWLDSWTASPLFMMGAGVLGAPNIGQGIMQGAQAAQHAKLANYKMDALEEERQNSAQRKALWGALRSGENHPLLAGVPDNIKGIALSLDPDSGTKLLQNFVLTRAKTEAERSDPKYVAELDFLKARTDLARSSASSKDAKAEAAPQKSAFDGWSRGPDGRVIFTGGQTTAAPPTIAGPTPDALLPNLPGLVPQFGAARMAAPVLTNPALGTDNVVTGSQVLGASDSKSNEKSISIADPTARAKYHLGVMGKARNPDQIRKYLDALPDEDKQAVLSMSQNLGRFTPSGPEVAAAATPQGQAILEKEAAVQALFDQMYPKSRGAGQKWTDKGELVTIEGAKDSVTSDQLQNLVKAGKQNIDAAIKTITSRNMMGRGFDQYFDKGEVGQAYADMDGAVRDAVYALSGKTVTKAEFDARLKQYMPTYGDTEERIKTKAERLKSFFDLLAKNKAKGIVEPEMLFAQSAQEAFSSGSGIGGGTQRGAPSVKGMSDADLLKALQQ